MSNGVSFNQVDWLSMIDTLVMWTIILVLIVVIGLLFYWLYNITVYNIYVELMRQVGEPYLVKGEVKINYKSSPRVAKLYNKRMKGGGSKEYFKIKGVDWDYQNYFQDKDFYFREPGLSLIHI